MRVWILLTSALLCSAGQMLAGEEYEEPPIRETDREHWSFHPIRTDLEGTVDSFLLEKLEESGIHGFAPRADDATLLRRLYSVLIGLPPTPEEILSFRYEDFEKKVDELLARPQYGERWAQHWLDVARFAETDGFEHDKIRKNAWKYRDWVIDAFNRDLPYDRFLAEQIAGDEMFPESESARLATGFLFSGPDMPDINLEEERRHLVLNEATGTVGSAFLGLTLSCAQCHDHKTDPVSQADFYRLRAFFDNAKLPPKNESLPHVFSENGKAVSVPSILRIRGDFRREGPALEPAVLRIADLGEAPLATNTKSQTSGRRSGLARWMIDPENPLVARVMVNRIWQHHFGEGLVRTPNDFGITGKTPSHPELLDWLATEFVRDDWSIKNLHKRILLSQAWQQASRDTSSTKDWEKRLTLDPENRLLSRQNRTRMSGEEIRDTMLVASGRMNLKAGGPGFLPPLPEEVTVTLLKNQWPVTDSESEHYRRSVYLFARRNLRYPLFQAFDRPDASMSCARRHQSITAPQSLMLLNSEFSSARAKDLAALLKKENSPEEQVRKGYLLTVARLPEDNEIRRSVAFLQTAPLEEFALALFNQNEFVFVD